MALHNLENTFKMLVLALQFSRDKKMPHHADGTQWGSTSGLRLPHNGREDSESVGRLAMGELNLHHTLDRRTIRQCTNWEWK